MSRAECEHYIEREREREREGEEKEEEDQGASWVGTGIINLCIVFFKSMCKCVYTYMNLFLLKFRYLYPS